MSALCVLLLFKYKVWKSGEKNGSSQICLQNEVLSDAGLLNSLWKLHTVYFSGMCSTKWLFLSNFVTVVCLHFLLFYEANKILNRKIHPISLSCLVECLERSR